MPILVSSEEVRKQSEAVFAQFGESKWIPFAKENARLQRRNAEELKGCGIGKTLVLAAMGASLEGQIETLKKYRDRYDLITCDKGFVPLLKRGIRPDYVMICDSNVRYAHMEDHFRDTEGIKLLATPYASPAWTAMWKGPRYFYVNRDAIQSEKVFRPIMGEDTRTIPASSNVSNAMLVFMTGCDENNQANWSGYEKFLLVGYDYSWRAAGNYYAWDNPFPKNAYMTHRTLLDINRDICRTSENLWFSMKWLHSYVTAYQVPAVNCSGRGILEIPLRGTLEGELSRVNPDPKKAETVRHHYKLAQVASQTFEASKELFHRSREELYHGNR